MPTIGLSTFAETYVIIFGTYDIEKTYMLLFDAYVIPIYIIND